ncbi:hypothetical protein GALMADRAFT_258291 [Galerina marginata CBS 339.88]|uniref:Uncharacterized protein n=1 Tax=Galerina marginata (strain CBS 339.88) TaxID=685588 RepID=A0A067S913_GALM3|nr:hypothetical protein GALMADRAFT_258291 [Galerina marginata CBS 339.88]
MSKIQDFGRIERNREMAFYRLQVEVLQRTADMGLFVWQGQSSVGNSMLAAKPDSFSSESSFTIQPFSPSTLTDDIDPSYSLTNFGLRIQLLVYRIPADKCQWFTESSEQKITLAEPLNITLKLQTRQDYDLVELAFLGKVDNRGSLAILLGSKGGQWKRISSDYTFLHRPKGTSVQTRFIR